jgi:hypothetical protein
VSNDFAGHDPILYDDALVSIAQHRLRWERMAITLNPKQEQVLQDAIRSGLANTADEALNQALDALRERARLEAPVDPEVAAAARRLGTFGKRHELSLGGSTIRDLLQESRA